MLKLRGKVETKNICFDGHKLVHACISENIPYEQRHDFVLIVNEEEKFQDGFFAYLINSKLKKVNLNDLKNIFYINKDWDYIKDKDILRIESNGDIASIQTGKGGRE